MLDFASQLASHAFAAALMSLWSLDHVEQV